MVNGASIQGKAYVNMIMSTYRSENLTVSVKLTFVAENSFSSRKAKTQGFTMARPSLGKYYGRSLL
jgi:hypothetical protein